MKKKNESIFFWKSWEHGYIAFFGLPGKIIYDLKKFIKHALSSEVDKNLRAGGECRNDIKISRIHRGKIKLIGILHGNTKKNTLKKKAISLRVYLILT